MPFDRSQRHGLLEHYKVLVFTSSSIVAISSGRYTSTSTSSASLALVATSNTSFTTHFDSKYLMLYDFDLFFRWLLQSFFFAITCYEYDPVSILSFLSFYRARNSSTYLSEYPVMRMVFA